MTTEPEALAKLIAKATDDDLSDRGRYFHDSCDDLTKCGHGDTGEYQHSPDGELVEFLWNNRRDYLARLAAEQSIASEVGREAINRALVLAMEDFINEPPRIYSIEPMEVREYRHAAYRIWSPLRDAILALAPATPAADAERLVEALQSILLYVDPEGLGTFDSATDVAGVKQNGELVLKGSFITICIRADAALSSFQAGGSGRG